MKSENFLPLLVQFLKLFHIANAKITTQNVLMQYLHHTNKPSLSELVKHILHLKVTFVFHTKQQNTKNGGCRQQQPTGGLTAQVGWLDLWVGSHLMLFNIHQMNSRNDFLMMTTP